MIFIYRKEYTLFYLLQFCHFNYIGITSAQIFFGIIKLLCKHSKTGTAVQLHLTSLTALLQTKMNDKYYFYVLCYFQFFALTVFYFRLKYAKTIMTENFDRQVVLNNNIALPQPNLIQILELG